MKKNFKCKKKEIEEAKVTNYGLRMVKYAVQALIGLGVTAVGFGVLGGAASFIPIAGGVGYTTFALSSLIKMYKQKSKEKEEKGNKIR